MLLFTSLVRGQSTTATEPIITKHASWYYYDGGDLAEDWYLQTLDKSWKKGQAPLGYNTDAITTKLDYGSDEQNKQIVYYFKKPVVLEQPSAHVAYVLHIRRDDGVIVYVNNKEVGRQNMFPKSSEENGNSSKRALGIVNGKNESKYYPMLLNASVFQSGLNMLSVSVHQRAGISSDLVFDLELRALNSLVGFEDEIKALQNLEHPDLWYALFASELTHEKTNTEYQLLLQKIDYINNTYKIVLGLLLVASLLLAWLTFYYQKRNKTLLFKLKDHDLFVEKNNQEKLKTNIQSIEYFAFLESLQNKLMQIQNSRVLQQKDIDALIQTIKNRRKNSANLEEIALHVDSLNANFSKRLLHAFPSLTQSEIRHCCLMRVQFSTKEISRILHVDPRSIQTARYRIKKKLNLKESENLVRFLLQY